MCAAVYGNVDQRLPQNIGGKTVAAELRSQHWKAFSEAVGLSPAATIRRVKELVEVVLHQRETVAAEIINAYGDPSRVLERTAHEIGKCCRRIERQL